MKKTYMAPSVKVLKLEFENAILDGSKTLKVGGDDEEVTQETQVLSVGRMTWDDEDDDF